MSEYYLSRSDAPFGEKVWEMIDNVVVGAARGQLSARRLLALEGPYGPGFKTLHGPTREIKSAEKNGGVSVRSSSGTPVTEISTTFMLAISDVAAYEQTMEPVDNGPIARAAITLANREDDLIFNGLKEIGLQGLMNAQGTQTFKLKGWDSPGKAADDLIQAVTLLDNAGFHGPYTLGLASNLYNMLFRVYANTSMTELQHLQTLVTDGIIKISAIKAGGVLIASGRQFASIALAQDILTSFVGPDGRDLEFAISESLALRVTEPSAICILQS
jgi:uncharacterized linocin/CFP29 family protein